MIKDADNHDKKNLEVTDIAKSVEFEVECTGGKKAEVVDHGRWCTPKASSNRTLRLSVS